MPDPRIPLLLDYLPSGDAWRILILEGGPGTLAREAARRVPRGEVLTTDRDLRAVLAAQKQLADFPNARATTDVLPPAGDWDVVLLPLPKERKFTRALLYAARDALRPSGQLILAGPVKGGAKAIIRDAEQIFGSLSAQSYRRHQRVAAFRREEQPPDANSPHPKSDYAQQDGRVFLELPRPEGALTLETHPGIFSWETIDAGTALLLEHLSIEPGSRVWDVGCGYGAIGLSAALAGAAHVRMSDVNLLALRYAQANAERNALAGRVTVLPADALTPLAPAPQKMRFDLIVSNPAFHQGRNVDQSMAAALIARAPEVLAPRGRLVLVANRFLPYDKLMRPHFPHLTKLVETGRYHVIEGRCD